MLVYRRVFWNLIKILNHKATVGWNMPAHNQSSVIFMCLLFSVLERFFFSSKFRSSLEKATLALPRKKGCWEDKPLYFSLSSGRHPLLGVKPWWNFPEVRRMLHPSTWHAPCRMGCRSFWKDLAPMCIHVHVDNVGRFLETVQRPQRVGWMVECPLRQGLERFQTWLGC